MSPKNTSGIYHKSYQPKDIFLLAFIILCLNTLYVFYNGYFLGLPYPYNTFLFLPVDRFADFLKVIDSIGAADTWEGEPENFIYYLHVLPFSAFLYTNLGKLIVLAGNKYAILITFYATILAAFIFIAKKIGNHPRAILFSILSYPMIFSMDRGNFALLVFLMVLVSMAAENLLLSTLAVAIATSIKITPAIFIVAVLLSRPISLKESGKVIIYFIFWLLLINAIAVLYNGYFIAPSFYDPRVLFTSLFGTYYYAAISNWAGLGYASSLYMPMAYIARGLQVENPQLFLKPIDLIIITFGIMGFLLLLKRKLFVTLERLLTVQKLTFVLCICFVLFMPVTSDYYLLIVLLPLIRYPQLSYSFGYFVVYGVLLGAKNFFYIKYGTSYQVFLNPILLLLLLFAEFGLIGFMKRDHSEDNHHQEKFIRTLGHIYHTIAALAKAHGKKIVIFVVVVATLTGSINYYLHWKEVSRKREFASNFNKKEWYYSVDGGYSFVDRADGALKGFDEEGNPLHTSSVWGIGYWKDENTIFWTAFTGSEAIWKARVIPIMQEEKPLTEEEKAKLEQARVRAKGFADAFETKEWYYSTDGGNSWSGRAEEALNGFDDNGNPVHVDPVWGTGNWKDANTITWRAFNGSESMWKALKFKASSLTKREIIKAKLFSQSFKNKKWYYSLDGGAHWVDRAESGFKEFDENGNPVHMSSVWGTGQWKDENTIYWIATNGTESLWKAFDTPPNQ